MHSFSIQVLEEKEGCRTTNRAGAMQRADSRRESIRRETNRLAPRDSDEEHVVEEDVLAKASQLLAVLTPLSGVVEHKPEVGVLGEALDKKANISHGLLWRHCH
eukprot:m.852513 g.852513  ORF g.852513 m.852513 type:complete len:104 (-) comp59600_c0_seq4:3456-3767(-)